MGPETTNLTVLQVSNTCRRQYFLHFGERQAKHRWVLILELTLFLHQAVVYLSSRRKQNQRYPL